MNDFEDDLSALETGARSPFQPAYDPNDRRSFIGGSDLPSIMGLNPPGWGTEVDLYFEKVDGPDPEDSEERAALFRRGKRLEPYAVQMLVEDHGVEVVARNVRYQDPDVPYFSCEIDFEWRDAFGVVQNGEIKTISPFATNRWGDEGTGDIPIEYACQAMWNLGVTRRAKTLVGALFGADQMVRYWIERDDEVIAAMRAKAEEFWNRYVLRRVPPPPRTLSDVGRIWPRETAKSIEATPEVAAAWTTLEAFRRRATAIDNAKDEAEYLIAEHMKDAGVLTYEGRRLCTYNEQSRTTVDADALRKEAPEIYARIAKTSKFRVMRKAQNRGA